MSDVVELICPYCGNPAELVTGDVIYPHRKDLSGRFFWLCFPCQAYVGTHRNSKRHIPLGRLANAELRKYKRLAHSFFDPLWKAKIRREGVSQTKARRAGYEWLASQLGVEVKECHIGSADVETCRRIIEICKPYYKRR